VGHNFQRRTSGGRSQLQQSPGAGANKKDKNSNNNNNESAKNERFEMQFFKTKVCAFWEKGRCTRGAACKYAHGEQELQAAPDLTNTALCREMTEKGQCTRPNCPFAHSWDTLRATEKFYKTTMCSFFRYGRCRLGNLCRHAHSREELTQAKRRLLRDEEASNASFDVGGRQERQISFSAGGLSATTAGTSSQSQCGEDKVEDSDDDFGDFAFDRNVTMPTSYKHQPHHFGAAPRQVGFNNPPLGPTTTWAEETEAEQGAAGNDDGSDDLSDEVDDMWARMQTMPATLNPNRAQQMMQNSQKWHAASGDRPVFAPISGAPAPRQQQQVMQPQQQGMQPQMQMFGQAQQQPQQMQQQGMQPQTLMLSQHMQPPMQMPQQQMQAQMQMQPQMCPQQQMCPQPQMMGQQPQQPQPPMQQMQQMQMQQMQDQSQVQMQQQAPQMQPMQQMQQQAQMMQLPMQQQQGLPQQQPQQMQSAGGQNGSPSQMMFMAAPCNAMGAPQMAGTGFACANGMAPAMMTTNMGDDSDDELTLGPAKSTANENGSAPAFENFHFWSRSVSLPAVPQQPTYCGMTGTAQGMFDNRQMGQPTLMVVPMMVMPKNFGMPGAGSCVQQQQLKQQCGGFVQPPSGPVATSRDLGALVAAAVGGDQMQGGARQNEDDALNQVCGWSRMVSAPAGGYGLHVGPRAPGQQQDFAKALCEQAVAGELEQRELEANLLRSAMPDTYED